MEGLAVSLDFWRGKRVLVTGHTGFKGSWLCSWLLRLGANVIGYALPPVTRPDLFSASRLERDVISLSADIRDPARLRAAMASHAPDVVFHLAAQALVADGYTHPRETYETNVIGTANVLEALRETPTVRAAVVVTSDKCYQLSNPDDRHKEDDRLGGDEPYSASKAGAELVVAGYRHAFFAENASRHVAVASARAGNIIGGGDWAEGRLIPDAVHAFSTGQPLILRNPRALRPWQYVLDPLRGYLSLAQSIWDQPDRAGPYNFGPPAQNEIEVADLVREFARVWGGSVRWETAQAPPFWEAPALRLDSTKAQAVLGWRARVGIGEALAWTAEWYRAFQSGGDAGALMHAALARYESIPALV